MSQRLASFAVLAIATAPSVFAQRIAAWDDTLAPQAGVIPVADGVRALPDGHTIHVATRLSHVFDVRRLDTNGDVVFAVQVPRDIGGDGEQELVDFDVNAAGHIVLLTERSVPPSHSLTALRAIRLDATGTVRWTRRITNAISIYLDGGDIRFASTGEIVVGAGRKLGGPSSLEAGAWVIWLAGTGAVLRRHHVPANDYQVSIAGDGSARVLLNGPAIYQTSLVRVNADATLGWTAPISAATSDFLLGAWAGPEGEAVVATTATDTTPGVLTKVDENGVILWDWTAAEPNPYTIDVQFLPGGDVVTSGPPFIGYVRRFDPAGALRFEVGGASVFEGAMSATVDAFDRTWFTRIGVSPSQTVVYELNVVDLNGVSVAAFIPPALDAHGIGLRNMDADARGNVYASMLWRETPTTETRARVVKFVLDPVGSLQVGCGPSVGNSTGLGARLTGAGSDTASIDGFCLLVDQLPASTLLLPLVSPDPGFVPMAGGSQGTLCLGGTVGRFTGPGQVRQATPDGSTSFQVPLDRIPRATGFVQAMAGETWHFQGWYRDQNPGSTSNFTNAWTVSLQ